jgi:hypothetical protein
MTHRAAPPTCPKCNNGYLKFLSGRDIWYCVNIGTCDYEMTMAEFAEKLNSSTRSLAGEAERAQPGIEIERKALLELVEQQASSKILNIVSTAFLNLRTPPVASAPVIDWEKVREALIYERARVLYIISRMGPVGGPIPKERRKEFLDKAEWQLTDYGVLKPIEAAALSPAQAAPPKCTDHKCGLADVEHSTDMRRMGCTAAQAVAGEPQNTIQTGVEQPWQIEQASVTITGVNKFVSGSVAVCNCNQIPKPEFCGAHGLAATEPVAEPSAELWEAIDGNVCDKAYDGDGFLNIPGEGSIHIPYYENAVLIAEAANKLILAAHPVSSPEKGKR